MKNDVNSTASSPENWTVYHEDLGTTLSCYGSEHKMAEHLTHFARKKIKDELLARIQLNGKHPLFGEYLQN